MKLMAWIYLLVAGLCEIGFTSCLKLSEGFTRPAPIFGFLIFAAASFWALTRSLDTIPLGTAYAVWTGIGALGTAIVGIVFFRDPLTFWRVCLLSTLIGSVVGLKFVGD
jgi:quaternary ammonium compound-resistance protein SugE